MVQHGYIFRFGDAPTYEGLRAMGNALPNAHDRKALAGFFFWSAWVDARDRPREVKLSSTSN